MRTTADILEVIKLCKTLNVQYLKYGSLEVHFESKETGKHLANGKVQDPEKEGPPLRFKENPFYQEQTEAKSEEVPDLSEEMIIKPMSVLDEMSSEEILYYATPYYDELQAIKAEHEEKLKAEIKE